MFTFLLCFLNLSQYREPEYILFSNLLMNANIITRHNIRYENLSSDSSVENKHAAILPSIAEELAARRVYLKQTSRDSTARKFSLF